MKNNVFHDIKSYLFQPTDRVLPDANFWLILYPPPSDANKAKSRIQRYSYALGQMYKAKCNILLNDLVASEYANRYLRIEFKALSHRYREFKDFRKSIDYKTPAKDAFGNLRHIMKRALTVDTPYSSIDHEGTLPRAESGELDYNDSLILESCRLGGWKLLTDDGDMKTGGVDVITGNSNLLQLSQVNIPTVNSVST